MSRPTLTPPTIQTGMENWDAEVQDGFDAVRDTLAGPTPMPVPEHSGDESDLDATFPPAQYDRCLVMVNHSVSGWSLYMSTGAAWARVGP